MSAGKVDVLAVMDRSRDVLGRLYFDFQRKIGPFASQANSAGIALAEARAAVAELIEAADSAMTAARVVALAVEDRHAGDNWPPEACVKFLRAHADALRAALARIGGEA